jgi:hypothetical protein
VWLFLVIAIVAFVAMLVRAVQHENESMVHVVVAAQKAEANGEVLDPARPAARVCRRRAAPARFAHRMSLTALDLLLLLLPR